MGEPALHQCLITFSRIDRGLLWAPPEGPQPAGQVMSMVVDAKLYHKQRTDPLQGPALCLKTRPQCSLGKPLQYVSPLGGGQSWWTARRRAALQAGQIIVVLPELRRPFADGHPTDAHTAGDLRLGQLPSLQQSGRLQAAFFTLGTGEVLWSPYHEH